MGLLSFLHHNNASAKLCMMLKEDKSFPSFLQHNDAFAFDPFLYFTRLESMTFCMVKSFIDWMLKSFSRCHVLPFDKSSK